MFGENVDSQNMLKLKEALSIAS